MHFDVDPVPRRDVVDTNDHSGVDVDDPRYTEVSYRVQLLSQFYSPMMLHLSILYPLVGANATTTP